MTSNAAELRSLLALAKENGVFFMEAMWTKFQPLARAFKRVLEDGNLGPPVSLHADLPLFYDIESGRENGNRLLRSRSSDVQASRQATGFLIQNLEVGRYSTCASLSQMKCDG